ncbi:VWA domain-containing protein [Streptomyces aureus]
MPGTRPKAAGPRTAPDPRLLHSARRRSRCLGRGRRPDGPRSAPQRTSPVPGAPAGRRRPPGTSAGQGRTGPAAAASRPDRKPGVHTWRPPGTARQAPAPAQETALPGDRHPHPHRAGEGGSRTPGPSPAGGRLPRTHRHRDRLGGTSRPIEHAPGPGPRRTASRRSRTQRHPWIHTQRKHTPTPPLRVAIAVDVSGSMGAAAGPIASAAWILARATALTDPDSRSATVAYDRALTAITAPGRTPARVTEFDASGSGHRLAEAIDALTAGLSLDHSGAGRLLVIASDGHYYPEEAANAAARVTALRTTGCAVLWLAFAPNARPLDGATFLELTDPTQAAAASQQPRAPP